MDIINIFIHLNHARQECCRKRMDKKSVVKQRNNSISQQ